MIPCPMCHGNGQWMPSPVDLPVHCRPCGGTGGIDDSTPYGKLIRDMTTAMTEVMEINLDIEKEIAKPFWRRRLSRIKHHSYDIVWYGCPPFMGMKRPKRLR